MKLSILIPGSSKWHSCSNYRILSDIRRWNLAGCGREPSLTSLTPVYVTAGERVVVDWGHVTDAYEVDDKKVSQTVFVYVCIVIERLLRKIQPHLNEGSTFLHSMEEKGEVWVWYYSGWSASCEAQCAWPGHSCPQPAAPRTHYNPVPVYLLCVTPRQLVHYLYRNLGVQWPTPHLWNLVWNKQCSSLAIFKPKEDEDV